MMQIRCSAKNYNLYNTLFFQNIDHYIVLHSLYPVNRLSVLGWGEKIVRREKEKGFPSLSSRFFHPFPKQRACSQATLTTVVIMYSTLSLKSEEL